MDNLNKLTFSNTINSLQMAAEDNNSEWLGIPKSLLMECAGYSFTQKIIEYFNLNPFDRVLIFSGLGNNGGDSFVIARHLSSMKIYVNLVLFGPSEKIRTEEARLNWKIINNLNLAIQIKTINDSSEIKTLRNYLKNFKFDLIIDGLLGTGIKGEIREPISSAIDLINDFQSKGVKIASIDVPSGMDPDSGRIIDKAVNADLVVTFHRLKKGLMEKTENIGKLDLSPIGIPLEANVFVGIGDFKPTIKRHPELSHKGENGKILVIGGSKEYSGAPALASLAALKMGVDLVRTYVPECISEIVKKYSPNLIVIHGPGNYISIDHMAPLQELIEWADAILLGPGMGINDITKEATIKILENVSELNKPCVIDADALKLIKVNLDLIKNPNIILTPHGGEFKIMVGETLPDTNNLIERVKVISDIAKKYGATFLVKGKFDIISNGIERKINQTGCSQMTVGGTGDVLAGLCAAFLSMKNNPFNSACSAAFLNGLVGEFCLKEVGEFFSSLDMIDNIPKTLKKIL
jgi:hydroxyethylthiazole kinase-like uncharacterized protein yjeF